MPTNCISAHLFAPLPRSPISQPNREGTLLFARLGWVPLVGSPGGYGVAHEPHHAGLSRPRGPLGIASNLSAWPGLSVCQPSAWSVSRPVALWHFLALHYYVRHHLRAFGDHWVSGSLKGAMRVPLNVLIVLLCSAYRAKFHLTFLKTKFWTEFWLKGQPFLS